MIVDINEAGDGRAVAVLLHPHPDYGGNRFHPFVDGLFRQLPGAGVHAVRFDFSSGDESAGRDAVTNALDTSATRWPGATMVLAGYSFGAGVAASVDDERLAGWYLLAPPAAMLAHATIGPDPRPKAIAVPEHDQFSSPEGIREMVGGWASTSVTVVVGADHFLGAVTPVVDAALRWIRALAPGPLPEGSDLRSQHGL